ncbi:MAG: hypothetical protein ABIS17_04890 [Casimicrobiaceae bacterium]
MAIALAVGLFAPALAGAAMAPGANESMLGSAAGLRARYEANRAGLEQSAFGQPIRLESVQTADRLKGDIYAVVDQPFDTVREGLRDVHHWCDILILHPNVTNCNAREGTASASSTVRIELGRNGTPVTFNYRVPAADAGYLHLALAAPDGPLGTTDYRVDLEASPLDARRSILHVVFSHRYGFEARLGMRAYLSTMGRGKVGFTVVDRTAEGQPVYVGDLRGALERNAMRYYVSIDAYLQALGAPPGQRLEKQIRAWYAYTERYPLQLRESLEYIDTKRSLARALRAPINSLAERAGN